MGKSMEGGAVGSDVARCCFSDWDVQWVCARESGNAQDGPMACILQKEGGREEVRMDLDNTSSIYKSNDQN
jgi:hypothetical protein